MRVVTLGSSLTWIQPAHRRELATTAIRLSVRSVIHTSSVAISSWATPERGGQMTSAAAFFRSWHRRTTQAASIAKGPAMTLRWADFAALFDDPRLRGVTSLGTSLKTAVMFAGFRHHREGQGLASTSLFDMQVAKFVPNVRASRPMPRMSRAKAVRVFRDQPNGIGTVSLVDPHRRDVPTPLLCRNSMISRMTF